MNINIGKSKGVALLGVLAVLIFVFSITTVAAISAFGFVESARVKESSDNALYCAQEGVESTIFNLRTNMGWNGTAVPVNVADLADPIKIVGTYDVQIVAPGAQDQGTWRMTPFQVTGADSLNPLNTRTLNIVVRSQTPAKFLMSAQGGITVGAGAQLDSDILASEIRFNANADSSKPTHVGGKALYTMNQQGFPGPNIEVDDGVEEVDDVTFPLVDFDNYKQMAQSSNAYLTGNTNLSDKSFSKAMDISGGTPSSGVIYVDGDVIVSGTFYDSMAIVATGKIIINGDILTSGDPVPQVGLFAGDEILFSSTIPKATPLKIDAFLMAENQISAEAGTDVDSLDFYGSMCVRGFDPSGSAINLSAFFHNRDYNHNGELVNNGMIPGMTFFANLEELAIDGDPGVRQAAL